METRGQFSLLGPRKCGNMRQPTVSEGPNDPLIEPEDRYTYHRKTTSHKIWPYVLKLSNYLVSAATVAAYHIYPHMAQLYPECNSPKYRKIFCPRTILALNFSSSCHIDSNDLKPQHNDDIILRLRNIVSNLRTLKTVHEPIIMRKVENASNCLRHIIWWGVCSPTTCCYQYIKFRNDVVVYQWFMCPGLGTTHRIKNYWTHLFLAGLFSHCTSAPIFVVGGRAYFGKCPNAIMFSWGGN